MEEVYIIDAETREGVQKQLQDAVDDIKDKSGDVVITTESGSSPEKHSESSPAAATNGGRTNRILDSAMVGADVAGFALVINGSSLVS